MFESHSKPLASLIISTLTLNRRGPHPQGAEAIQPAAQQFEANIAQVTAARHFVAATLSSWGLASDDAAIVVTELATNALIHAESPFAVSVSFVGGRLRVEVTDHGPGLPTMRGAGGRAAKGLTLVDRLSQWGVRRHMAGGKTIWVELRPMTCAGVEEISS